MRFPRRRTAIAAGAAFTALTLTLAGCADAGTEGTGSGSAAAAPTLPAAYLEAAKTFATGLTTGGAEIGGTVTVIGTLAGTEKERLLSTFAPFEEATGVKINYTGTEDYTTVIQAGVDSGNPPDVMTVSSLAMVRHYAEQGALKDLDTLVGTSTLTKNFNQGLVDATTVGGKPYALYMSLDNFMVWYNPQKYDGPTDGTWSDLSAWTEKKAASGSSPWCLGLSAGASTGWPGAFMVLNQIVKSAGPDVANGLATGATKWSDPQVKAAFQTVGDLIQKDGMVYGGASGALSTEQGSAGNGMYTDPQQCSLFEWGTYGAATLISGNATVKAGENLDFMPIPASNPQFANTEAYTGTVVAAFSDRPEVKAFLQYMASTEEQTLIAATGNYVAPATGVPADAYPNDVLRKVSTEMLSKDLTPLPSATIDTSVRSTLYTAFANFVQDPSTLDAGLKTIDDAQAALG
ncbi:MULTISPECIES: extracellular solute-binding protein [Actinoplanes]|uniref:ABC transporter substrate-binding protein n=1 Tax=Actinoplanes TaxID=1865 RepID=UPI0005F2A4AD|nr:MULTISPECIES: extracellular solute-binding protein [Actinoplanes]GLY08132.1 ABC transporter substrate-binding protein [Actinoplanes sp. NBRC 101535]